MAQSNYRISLGNSNTTGIGVCFTVRANSEQEAITLAQEGVRAMFMGLECGDVEGMEDVCVYAGPELVVIAADIDDVTEDEEDEQDEQEVA